MTHRTVAVPRPSQRWSRAAPDRETTPEHNAVVFSEPSPDDAVAALDDPVGASLRSRHHPLGRRHGSAHGYVPEVASFVAVPVEPHASDWDDLGVLLGRGGFADLFSSPATPPPGWEPVFHVKGLQLLGPVDTVASDDDGPRLVDLGPADVPETLDVATRTRLGHPAGTPSCGRHPRPR